VELKQEQWVQELEILELEVTLEQWVQELERIVIELGEAVGGK
jgi:hypothetical protein